MLDDMTKKAREQLDDEHLPWDEMREARNLKSTLAAWKEEQEEQGHAVEAAPSPERTPNRAWIGLAVAAGLAGLVVGGMALLRGGAEPEPGTAVVAEAAARADEVAPVERVESPTPPVQTPSQDGSPLLAFADGSRAHLSADASVVLAEENEGLLRLQQSQGEVRYEVEANPERRFVVEAAGVNVEVVGTVFVVLIAVDRVDVSVERGKVRVLDGEREITLEADERISVKRSNGEVLPADADTEPAPEKPSAAALMDDYDQARANGDLAAAGEALEQLIRVHPKDSRVPVALVSLGRLEAQRGHHVAAAKAFERYYARFPEQSLAEDALAEAAKAWKSASRPAKAQDAARRYLDRFPQGIHTDAMRRMLD